MLYILSVKHNYRPICNYLKCYVETKKCCYLGHQLYSKPLKSVISNQLFSLKNWKRVSILYVGNFFRKIFFCNNIILDTI